MNSDYTERRDHNCNFLCLESLPIHKATIMPRGRALGMVSWGMEGGDGGGEGVGDGGEGREWIN